jgi:hypothetical protein
MGLRGRTRQGARGGRSCGPIGDIGYWAPDGNLVLYYGDVGYWTGTMRIGEFDDMQAVAEQSDDFTATVDHVQ